MSDRTGLEPLFSPTAIAIVGASRDPDSVSGHMLQNLMDFGFKGVIYPVNPSAEHIRSIRAYPTVGDIPGNVDMAVIVVPARFALQSVKDCVEKGIKGILVITAGFREIGGKGVEMERELLHAVHAAGGRMVGPNCMGLINTHPDVSMNATFAPTPPRPGNIAFLSQSGALGVGILNHADRVGVGFSHFISVGNAADVGILDCLRHWEDDDDVRSILLYLESVGAPREFFELARRISRRKPIVVLKSGRTQAGARAAASHTGSLATKDFVIDALFAQAGVLRVTSMNALFDLGMALSRQPLPLGRRVAIITNAGGPAIMATDALVGAGLELAELSEATNAGFRSWAPPEASLANPIDLIATANPESYGKGLALLGADPGVDVILCIYVPPVAKTEVEVAEAIVTASALHGKTTLTTFMGRGPNSAGAQRLNEGGVPNYVFPESAVRTLANMIRYRELRERESGHIAHFEVDRAAARKVIDSVKAAGRHGLTVAETRQLLGAYGIPQPAEWSAPTLDEIDLTALPYPVALKAVGPDVAHRTDFGGVATDLHDAGALRLAYEAMVARVAEHGAPVVAYQVQEMVGGVAEVIVGHLLEPKFGPVLVFGSGGTHVELLKDVTFRLAPVTELDASEMIREIKGWPLLDGFRGAPKADVPAVEDLLLRVSKMVVDLYEISEVDFNPVIVCQTGNGVSVVDAKVRLSY